MGSDYNGNNGRAVAALVLGIVSCVCFCLSFTYVSPLIGLVAGVVGLILGIGERKENPANGLGTAGMVLSIIGLSLCAITTVACIGCYGCLACSAAAPLYW